jgi:hypothetical protein
MVGIPAVPPLAFAATLTFTGGALYYAYLHAMDPAGWFERNFVNTPDERPEVATIGHHVFYA